MALGITWVGVKSQAQGRVNVDELMKYPSSPLPYRLGTADGYMAKTDNSNGMQFLLKGVNDAPLPDDANTMFI